eukprot:TRINITY_DN46743_c0_g1_i1.p2 TRINITY_DN46743_c0_g1~~TRINITY_DN46743_c0_g1_i1.p2  ORF type:complete len:108 (+),score=36.07 TRINITY_DN46743_c0_g1_i1:58-381(+)
MDVDGQSDKDVMLAAVVAALAAIADSGDSGRRGERRKRAEDEGETVTPVAKRRANLFTPDRLPPGEEELPVMADQLRRFSEWALTAQFRGLMCEPSEGCDRADVRMT